MTTTPETLADSLGQTEKLGDATKKSVGDTLSPTETLVDKSSKSLGDTLAPTEGLGNRVAIMTNLAALPIGGNFEQPIPTIQALPYPQWIDTEALTASTPTTHAVPAGANYVLISATGSVYVDYNNAAAIPSGQVLTGVGSELNPGLRCITGLTFLGLVSPANCIVTLCFFA